MGSVVRPRSDSNALVSLQNVINQTPLRRLVFLGLCFHTPSEAAYSIEYIVNSKRFIHYREWAVRYGPFHNFTVRIAGYDNNWYLFIYLPYAAK